ncbi:MAG: hypothetical protein R3C59_20035 [Planctomycetaceae bacterium]
MENTDDLNLSRLYSTLINVKPVWNFLQAGNPIDGLSASGQDLLDSLSLPRGDAIGPWKRPIIDWHLIVGFARIPSRRISGEIHYDIS